MTSERAAAAGGARVVIWEGEVPVAMDGVLFGPRVVVCRRYLRPPSCRPPSPTVATRSPVDAEGVVFRVMLADDEEALDDVLAQYSVVGRIRRCEGGEAAVGVRQVKLESQSYDTLEYLIEEARRSNDMRDAPGDARIIGVVTMDDGGFPLHADLPLH